ncbi:thiamine pyrophosphate enzyme-like TPP-binding protein [alpha proteobacterium BAL199]|jgi:thiamine pyrophosphate-dependent acetolactate synthase large subunit-like protein|nr:thiamine pyrophosphate enzyme-like TPP-binding protein [alpha proteobacterium BAL199]
MRQATLDRRDVLARIFPDPDRYLFISGLAGPARDTAGLTKDGANTFTMAGAMGAATTVGLGLALSAPDRKVAVVTGDGELLMNIGSLVTVASMAPPNLTIVCIDNGCHGETGGQTGHTSRTANLEQIAKGAGIASSTVVETEADLDKAAAFLEEMPGPRFIQVRVTDGPPTNYKRNFNMAECRIRFRTAAMNTAGG